VTVVVIHRLSLLLLEITLLLKAVAAPPPFLRPYGSVEIPLAHCFPAYHKSFLGLGIGFRCPFPLFLEDLYSRHSCAIPGTIFFSFCDTFVLPASGVFVLIAPSPFREIATIECPVPKCCNAIEQGPAFLPSSELFLQEPLSLFSDSPLPADRQSYRCDLS